MKLLYFEAFGRAHSIRVLLNHAGVEFEDVAVKREDWPELKKDTDKFPSGQMPVLEKDGKYYDQSTAILRMLGREHGYYPSDAEELYQVEKAMEMFADFTLPMIQIYFMKDEEEK